MRITSENGHQRPTLSEQINRLDAILDGLADNLNEAVARAVREAVGSAVKEALQGVLTEVLNHPEPLNKLRPEPVVKASPAPPPATSVAEQGWLGRLAGVAQAAAGTVVHLTRRASARVAQLAPGWWKTIAAHLASSADVVARFADLPVGSGGVGVADTPALTQQSLVDQRALIGVQPKPGQVIASAGCGRG